MSDQTNLEKVSAYFSYCGVDASKCEGEQNV